MGQADADYETPPREPRLGFAEVVCRDPFSIVGRYPNPGFRLADLAQMRIATVSEVPTPWSCLQEQVGIESGTAGSHHRSQHGRKLQCLNRTSDRVAQFFEPVVEQALASGKGSPMARGERAAAPVT
jgi:NitT/TauT family transport system substrate-binding protein